MSDYLKYINYDFKQGSKIFKVNTDTALLGMFIDDIKNKTVLDIGCGSGALLLYSHYHKASKLIGVDIQKEALKYADINLSKYTDNYALHNKRIQDYKGDRVDINNLAGLNKYISVTKDGKAYNNNVLPTDVKNFYELRNKMQYKFFVKDK